MENTLGFAKAQEWFTAQNWEPQEFQLETWGHFLTGRNGMLNAPTGSGKTLALWIPNLIQWVNEHPTTWQEPTSGGLKVIWLCPIRALANDLKIAFEAALQGMGIAWTVAIRTGDSDAADKAKMKKQLPDALITTPESLHIMLASKDIEPRFKNLKAVIVDEWHELMGTKRGVQTELAMAVLRTVSPNMRTWCISATIGNLDQALEVFLGDSFHSQEHATIKVPPRREIAIHTILPDEIERFPWSGHIGVRLKDKVMPIVAQSASTLLFTNTRAQSEIWYKAILDSHPELAGLMAIHHGSLSTEVRKWVEQALHAGQLKLVICTSSLDLGVDFSAVDSIIQVGSPKGVARFVQRAGRSGHRPDAASHIWFLPTHAIELVELAALRQAIKEQSFEDRPPLHLPIDVLVQFMVTIACGDGFASDKLFEMVRQTYTYEFLSQEQWNWCIQFIVSGGEALTEYDEFSKVILQPDGQYKVMARRTSARHRMSIGTIVTDQNINIRYQQGGYIGSIEESFISKLKAGDVFWFAGRPLEFVRIKDLTATVKKSKSTKGAIPSWMGARMSLSNQLAHHFKLKLQDFALGQVKDEEIAFIAPVLDVQQSLSCIPLHNQILIEETTTEEGHHLFFYPFAGRALHEGMASIIAFRLAARQSISFTISLNDYGFELISDQKCDVEAALEAGLFSPNGIHEDMVQSINATELAKRKFRDIAQIGGLMFNGFPGALKQGKFMQASSSLLFEVFAQHDPDNLLVQQAYGEVYSVMLNENQLVDAFEMVQQAYLDGQVLIKQTSQITPFAFPLMVDRLNQIKVTSEKLIDRIMRIQAQLEASYETWTEAQ